MSCYHLPTPTMSIPLWFLAIMLFMSMEDALSIDAKHWQQLPDLAQRYYLLGSVEAWSELIPFASDLSEPTFDGMLNTVLPCIKREKVHSDHLMATVKKYLNHHPSESEIEMSALVFAAVSEACAERKEGLPSQK